MATALATLQGWRAHSMTSVRLRLTGLFGSVALLHLLGWGTMLVLVAPRYPVMLGLGGLAYTFGLRRAFDADHISAIDNTTRNFLQEGQKPLGVVFFFSLCHSTVVFVIAVALGFDTASGISLLAISAGAAAQHLPLYALISLPLIFAAGMSLMDTADGAFMSRAYSWAFSNPVRRVFYNLTMTGLSVFVALFVGLFELSQLMIQQLHLRGRVWDAIGGMDLGVMGFVIVGAFVVTWAGALLIYRGLHVEERWSSALRH